MSRRFKARDWESSEFEEERETGKPIVETFGNPNKCVFCNAKPTRLAHCWLDEVHVKDLYVCDKHFRHHVLPNFDSGFYRYLAYKILQG